MAEQKARLKLKELTGKKHIFFTDRGNTSILLSLKLAKHIGKKKVFIQDQGGWITYEQFIRKLKFDYEFIETDYGLVNPDNLDLGPDSVLLINSMPGYFALQDMAQIEKLCNESGALLINDVSGSIGTKAARYGDIILGSFGRWKPVYLEYGGFIAFDESPKFFEENFTKELKDFFSELDQKLEELPARLKKIDLTCKKIKQQLKEFDVIHRDKKGLNVIVKFSSDEEKMKILDFCKVYSYEFTLCPMYIRVMENAVSIEVKRAL
jgi:hypothetical protein